MKEDWLINKKARMYLHIIILCSSLLCFLFCFSCQVEAKQKIELTMNMTVNNQENIPISVNNGNFYYKSSNLNVLQFTSSGKMIALKSGTVIVTLSYPTGVGNTMNRTYFKVKVHDKVKKLSWKKCTGSITIGSSYVYKVKYKAASRKNVEFEWKSSKPGVASVNSKGKVTGYQQGSTTITCTVKGQKKKKIKCKLKVVPVLVTNINLNENKLILAKDETYDLSRIMRVEPLDATNSDVKMVSSDSKVVSVSKGVLKAKKVGEAEITITAKDASGVSNTLIVQVESQYSIDNYRCIAHRGLSTSAPENTVKAFELAGEAGFYGVETDIWLSKDGQFVLHHDEDLLRCCGVNKKICDFTYEEIRKIPIINGRNYKEYKNDISATRIPTLTEYLTVCKKYNMVPQIEIKFVEGTDILDSTNALYRLYKETRQIMGNNQIMFAACNYQTLVNMHRILQKERDKNCKIFQILGKVDAISQISNYDELKQNGFGLDIRNLSSDSVVQQLIKDGVEVDIWCVDDCVEAEKYLEKYKVDFLTTNFALWE